MRVYNSVCTRLSGRVHFLNQIVDGRGHLGNDAVVGGARVGTICVRGSSGGRWSSISSTGRRCGCALCVRKLCSLSSSGRGGQQTGGSGARHRQVGCRLEFASLATLLLLLHDEPQLVELALGVAVLAFDGAAFRANGRQSGRLVGGVDDHLYIRRAMAADGSGR